MTRAATVTTVRETTEAERATVGLRDCAWVATDSNGYRFGGASPDDAREVHQNYYHPPRYSARRQQEEGAA
jgi:hypothetical protein